jgi:hypothetical protein
MTRQTEIPAWTESVAATIAAGCEQGTFIVCFPGYRPELVRALADRLGYDYLDFRAASLAPLGWRASALTLDALDQTIGTRAARGLVLNNAEALLATKPMIERVAWLGEAVTRTSGAPVLVSLAVFANEAPANSARVCHIDTDALPPEKLIVRLASQ